MENKYEGEYKDDKRNRQGTFTWASGNKYDLKELFESGGKIQLNSKWDKYDTKELIEAANEGGGLAII